MPVGTEYAMKEGKLLVVAPSLARGEWLELGFDGFDAD
jgi:hypothetical protein